MKYLIIILLISLAIISNGQIVEVQTTLLRIDGVDKFKAFSVDVTSLPLACEYVLVVADTMDLTTTPIDSLQFENTQMKEDIIQLQNQVVDLYNKLLNKVDYSEPLSLPMGIIKMVE